MCAHPLKIYNLFTLIIYISLSLFVSPCTVRSFVELVKFVFTIPGVTVFLSGRICQDPLEGFLGQQRQRGRVNENPSVQQFVENTRALRVINGACRQVRGTRNVTQKAFKNVIKQLICHVVMLLVN